MSAPATSLLPRPLSIASVLLLGVLSIVAGWMTIWAPTDLRAVTVLLGLCIGAASVMAGPRRVAEGIGLAAFVGVIALTAVRHSQEVVENPPHPFYTVAVMRVLLPELLLLVAWAGAVLTAPSPRDALRMGVVPILVLGFLVWGLLVGVVRGDDPEAAIRDGRKVASLVLAHAVVVAMASGGRGHRLMGWTLALAAAAGAAGLIVRYASGIGFHYGDTLRATVDVGDFVVMLGLLCIPLAVWRAKAVDGRMPWVIAALALSSIALLTTGSRAAWGAIPVGLAVVFLFPFGEASKRRLGLILVVLATVGLLPFLWADLTQNTVERVVTLGRPIDDPSVHYRLHEVEGAAEVVASHPIAGTGFGVPFEVGESLIDRRARDQVLVHNVGLWAAIKGGLIGLVLLAAALVITVRSLTRVIRDGTPMQRGLALGFLGTIAAALAIGMVGAMLNQIRVTVLLGLVSGFAHLLAQKVASQGNQAQEATG